MEADATDQATRLRRAAADYESAEQQALDAAKNIRHRTDALIARILTHQEHGSHLWPGLIDGVPAQSIHDLNRALGEMTALARLLEGTPRKGWLP